MQSIEARTAAVAGRYAGLLLEYLRARGFDPTALFSAQRIANIDASDASVRLSADDYLAMLETAMAATGDADLGFNAGMDIQPRHLGVVGHVLMCCANLDEAITQYGRYVRLVHGMTRPLLVRHSDDAEMFLDWPSDGAPPPVLAQLVMVTRVRMTRFLTGRSDLLAEADFQFERPASAGCYEQFFGARVRFAQSKTRLVFPADYLDLPIRMADPEMARIIHAQAETLMRSQADEPELLWTIRASLSRGMTIGRVTAGDVAVSMGISTRTLHRRLHAHGYSFRTILDTVRREQAEHYLGAAQPSLAEVAFMLGYAEQSAFQHAFRRWSDETPGQFRARALVSPGGTPR